MQRWKPSQEMPDRRPLSRTCPAGLCTVRRWRPIVLALAALPLFQVGACSPDLTGALNFQVQLLFNTALVNAADTIIQNILGL